MKSHNQYLKIAVAILLLTGAARGQEPSGSVQAGVDYVPGEIIILLRSASEDQVAIQRASTNGVQRMGIASLDQLNTRKGVKHIGESAARQVSALAARRYVLSVPEGQEINLVKAYLNNEHVELASLNHIYQTALTPNDTNWLAQWNFDDDHLQAEEAWDVHTGSPNVLVGVIDTGLDYDHPDLSPNMWSGRGRDYCGPVILRRGRYVCGHPSGNFDNDPQHVGGVSYSHGTKMAGVIAARTHNNSFVAGLAGGWNTQPGVQLMGLRAGFDNPNGRGGPVFASRAADAINWAMGTTTTEPIVFNMSWVGPSSNSTLRIAIATEWSTDRAVFVGAARLANISAIGYPAGYPNVIGVTGVTQDDVKGADTGYGSYVDVAAPVEDVPTVRYDASTGQHEYHLTGGTTPSISTAQVSGLAALVWSKYPELTNAGVVHQIVSTADDISAANLRPNGDPQPWSGQIGGRINAYRALTEWSGPLLVQAGETLTWGGTITITNHVTIPEGITLELEAGTEVRFQARNVNRLQLIVAGTLDASAGDITFHSTNTVDPSNADWYGIRVRNGGTANLSGATIRDGLHCVQDEGGTLTGTPDCGLTLTSDRTAPFSFDEDVSADPPSRTTVATYRVEDTEGAAVSSVTWSLAGDDEDSFLIEDGELIFNQVLDFEQLAGEGGVNDQIDYQVTVQAAVDLMMLEQEVMVTIRNVDEEGMVTVAPTTPREDGTTSPPRQGEELTARLTDPDAPNGELSMVTWTWARQTSSNSWDQVATSSGSASSTYTPEMEDVGHSLRALVSYQDGAGTDEKTAQMVTEPVESVGPVLEAPVGLRVTAELGQINLRWDEVAAASAYQVQYERIPAQPKPVVWPSNPTYVMQATVNGQTHYNHRNYDGGYPIHPGHRYRYQVRAQNSDGDGAWSESFPEDGVIALPRIEPRLQRFVLDDETTGLVATWECPYAQLCGPIEPDWPVAALTLQAQIKSGSSWSADMEATVDEETITHRVSTLDRTVVHEFRTRAANADGGASDTWSWSAAVALIPLSVESGADGNVTLDWDSPNGYGGLTWQYRYKALDNAQWGRWQRVSGGATTQTVPDLTAGESYQFQVRGRSGSTARVVSFIESSTQAPEVTVSYGSASYSAREGGDAVTIAVQLSEVVNQSLNIPIKIAAEGATEASDFSDDLGGARELSFAPNELEASFTITANEDEDTADEEVTLGFGTLPSGVSEGTPASATVTLIDNDPDGEVLLSPTQPQVDKPVTATLTDPDGGITGARWQWQRRADDASPWRNITCSSSTRSSSYPELSSCTPQSVDASYQLRATVSYVDDASADANDRQEAASAATEAVQDPSPVINVTVSYGSASYSAREGGDAVTIAVQLSEAVNQSLNIPIKIAAEGATEGSDFSDDLGGARELSFAPNAREASFTITANEDSDVADEEVTLGFGTLPSGVS